MLCAGDFWAKTNSDVKNLTCYMNCLTFYFDLGKDQYICIISKESLCVIIATESNMLFMFPLCKSQTNAVGGIEYNRIELN